MLPNISEYFDTYREEILEEWRHGMRIQHNQGDKISVFVDETELFTGIEVCANTTRGKEIALKSVRYETTNSNCCVWFTDEKNTIRAEVSVDRVEDRIALRIVAECLREPMDNIHSFLPDNGIILRFDPVRETEGICAVYREDAYWTSPYYSESMTQLPMHTQAVLYQKETLHICYLTKCMDNAFTELCGYNGKVELRCSDECGSIVKISGEALAVGISSNAQESVRICYGKQRRREERRYPKVLESLGWCSWNAFYRDVDAIGIREKLAEFQRKGLPVKWILIDDGWSQTKDEKLLSFEEDKSKFPQGLSGLITEVKEQFSVENVGVWQAFTGYWNGIHKESEVYHQQRQNLYETKAGFILPSGRSAFDFWNSWHKYLRDQGVDFVKVDVQGGLRQLAAGGFNTVLECEKMQEALDASAEVNFDGNLINCMGMGQENAQKRPISGLMRNSGDFFPDMENGFLRHARQNALNSLFFGHTYYTDWDMWWTRHETATQNAVIRAISGGPIYISDKVGDTIPEEVWPLIEDDGRIIRCDRPALPTDDCIYRNCEGDVLKLWNVCGDCGVLAIFCFDPNGCDITVSEHDVKMSGNIMGYCFFAKRFFCAKKGTVLHLDNNGVEIINFYPIEDGKVQIGDLSKYISAGSCVKKELCVIDIME